MPSTHLADRLAARITHRLVPAEPPALWPRFSGSLHTPAVAARVGRVLGVCFGVCFVTGVISYYHYVPWRWLPPPASPVWGYRLTQGAHVVTGIASIPLLLVKLWTVYPRLFEWPPAKSLLQLLERASIAVLVASSLVELSTGLLDVLDWYPWPWSFTFVHRQLAYVVVGALLLHIAVKLPVIREGLATPLDAPPERTPALTSSPARDREPAGAPAALSRRGLLTATGVGAGVVAATTVGQSFQPLHRIALLAPRTASRGPLGVPVNRTSAQAAVRAGDVGSSWRLTVTGRRPFALDLEQLEALATVERELPIACVEGWSVSARWRGPLLMDLVRRAGGDDGSTVRVASLQRRGAFAASTIDGPQLRGAVLATHLDDVRIPLDHGYPVRLIAPGRPGVFNTKWLTRIEVR